MKHPKKLNVAMKKLLHKNNLDPNDWWYIENTASRLVILNKINNKVQVINK